VRALNIGSIDQMPSSAWSRGRFCGRLWRVLLTVGPVISIFTHDENVTPNYWNLYLYTFPHCHQVNLSIYENITQDKKLPYFSIFSD
jgi:hypothetical protein